MAPYSSIPKILFTFTIGLPFIFLLISIQVHAVRPFVNTEGPKPQIWFVAEPPNAVIASPGKNKYVHLQCHATVELQKDALKNLQCGDSSDYDEVFKITPEDDYADEDTHDDPLRQKRIRDGYMSQIHKAQQALTHFSDLKPDGDVMHLSNQFGHGPGSLDNFEDEEDDNEGEDLIFGGRGRQRRNVNRPQEFPRLEYVWYRDGEPLLTTSDSTLTLNGFRLTPNGTLRIQYSNLTSGVYRCMANETQCGIGAVLSKNVVVKVAMLERDSISNNSHNIVAIRGSSIVLNCPFKSYPAAKFSWYFNKLNEAMTTMTPTTSETTQTSEILPTIPMKTISTASSTLTPIVHNKDNRYFLLSNGSLLITSLMANDTGRYKCNALNEYMTNTNKKNQRTNWVTLKVEEPVLPDVTHFGLQPPLQMQNISVPTHDVLRLHCASFSEKITWSFTPRKSNIPIPLTDFTNELKYVNASIDKHDGVYNCSTPSGDYQTFNVTVTSPPVLSESLDSRKTSVATSMTFNCSATGNPPPTITWYHNGKLIQNNYITSIDVGRLRINSVEPEDQGIYECFARNDVGEVKSSAHLTVRHKEQYKDLARPMNVKCYPADFNSVVITFESKHKYNMINYYIATKDPYTWQSPPPLSFLTSSSFKITTYMDPLKKYGLYMRGIIQKEIIKKSDPTPITLTRMSDLVECATQGIPVRYTSMSNMNSIFIWWADTLKLNLTSMIIQFLHNDTMNPPLFAPEIIGTYTNFPGTNTYLMYSEFSSSLEKIPAETKIADNGDRVLQRNKRDADDQKDEEIYMKISRLATRNAIYPNSNDGKISEVKVFGNVTGILIPNSQRIIVRVLGSTEPDGHLFPQDLKYVPWTTVELDEATPKAKLKIVEAQARSIRIEWTPLEDNLLPNNCIEVCYKDMINDYMQRGGRPIDCRKIDWSMNKGILDKLTSRTSYKVFIRACNNTQPLSEVLDITTKQDVPGVVSRQNVTKEKDGIVLHWDSPAHPNGVLLYYLIEWTKDGLDFAHNVSLDEPFFYKFPNTTANDKFNMSIRAVSTVGEGIPILIDLRSQSIFDIYDFTTDDSILGIAVGIFLSIFCIIICIWIFVRNRNCNKSHQQNHQTSNNNHSSVTTGAGQNPLNCTADVHEMQTLITHHDVSTIVSNGTIQHYTRPDVTEVDNIRTLTNEKPKLLKSSPKLSVRTIEDGQSFELEPLQGVPNGGPMTTFKTKNGNGTLPSGVEKPRNGVILQSPYNNSQVKTISSNSLTNGHNYMTTPLAKTNGNLRITENPQYLKPSLDTSPITSTSHSNSPLSTFLPFDAQHPSSTPNNSSIFDTSQQKLLANSTIDSDTSDSTSNFNNKYNNSNNINNRNIITTKIDDKLKTSTLKNLNKQQQDDLSYDMNTSNLSTKPLTNNTNGWLDSYRQPIVGPNG